mmetsp:Transcript_3393/g.8078  ORF Transcript_3393/g.8078 Transcript_3393/m.8078 type:complete len:237 (+) Transcript_3393:156-866(+)
MRRPEQSHTQLERELAILSNHPIQDAGALVTVKQRVRVIKNRLSAKRSREQARHYVEELEKNVAHLASESEKLSRRLAQVEEENRRLMATTPDGAQAGPCAQEPVALPVVAAEKEQVKEPAVLPQTSLQLDALLLFLNTLAIASGRLPASASSSLAPAALAQKALQPAMCLQLLRWHARRALFFRWLQDPHAHASTAPASCSAYMRRKRRLSAPTARFRPSRPDRCRRPPPFPPPT